MKHAWDGIDVICSWACAEYRSNEIVKELDISDDGQRCHDIEIEVETVLVVVNGDRRCNDLE